jgi:hypothetical protein
MDKGQSWAQNHNLLLVTIINYSLKLLVSKDHVLECTSNSVTSNRWFLILMPK